MLQYTVVIENGESAYGAYVPDLPGCTGIGKTRAAAIRSIRKSITLYLEELRRRGLPVPRPGEVAEMAHVAVPEPSAAESLSA